MENTNELAKSAFDALRVRLTNVMPAQIRACIEQLDDEQLWWRPNGASNSVGNLVLHVNGALLHFLCRGVGGMAYERDRPAEFAATGSITQAELLATFDELVKKIELTFALLDASRLAEPSTEPAYYATIFEDLFGVAIHLAAHMGQIVYVTKMLKENSIHDLWSQTHKAGGAWRT